MRYEDASGSFQASGPIANDDSDTLPAGSRQAATGNLITGEGTQYGSAGADSAAGAHITSIGGKGGEDSSFSGGKLSVSGEHGNLNVDADGNYSYLANKGAPENVRDRFTYTLADNQGNSDTAALIIELGKTPVVIKADAQQIVPGPDGVVTLPPGVTLSDVMVVGRNLVINMPDGTQLIIVDGAVFVPQLVFDGVQVPATNVAALLIGQEPQPAAGELPPSSGGNFALPPPPLDPGVPLGDLIPPMEDTYIPPEPQEVLDQLDEEPEDFGNIDILVDDDTFPGGRAGGLGDGPDAVNIIGFLAGLGDIGGDGPLTFSLQLASAPDGFAFVSGGPGVVFLQQNGVTVRTITFDPATGEYEVTQNAPIQHPPGSDENDFVIVLTVTVTDQDGDTATGTITITLDDDTPEAHDDTDAVIKGDTSTDGNVMTGVGTTNSPAGIDFEGADGAEVTGVRAGTTGSFTSVPDGGVTISGEFGDLTLNPDGSYTYTLHAEVGDGGNDVFTYQLTDGDGDVVTATLTITVPPDLKPTLDAPNVGEAGTIVDEAGLPPRGAESAGTGEAGDGNPNNESDDSEVTTGTINFTPGDTPSTITINGVVVTGVGQTFAGDYGTLTITGFNPNGSITYTYTLEDNVDHDTDATPFEEFDIVITDDDGDTATDTLRIDIVDDEPIANNDTDSVTEDGPLVANGNVISGVGSDGNPAGGDLEGADDAIVTNVDGLNPGVGSAVATPGGVAIVGQYGTLVIQSDGSYTYTLDNTNPAVQALSDGDTLTEQFEYTLLDGDGDTDTAILTITINGDDDVPTVDVPTQGEDGTLVDEAGLPPRGSEPPGTGEVADGNPNNESDDSEITSGVITYTPGDGATTITIDGVVISGPFPQTIAGDYGTLTITGHDPVAHTISYTYTLEDNVDHDSDATPFESFAVVVSDSDGNPADDATGTLIIDIVNDEPIARDDTDSVVEGDSTTGNVITGTGTTSGVAGADTPGADNFAPSAVVGVVAGDNDAVDTNNPATVGVQIVGTYGTLTLNADGSYTYEADAGSNPPPGAVDEFVYTVIDNDGNMDSAVLTISVIDDLQPTVDAPNVGEAGTVVDEAGLPPRGSEPPGTGENADGNPANESDDSEITSGTINFTLGDTPSTVTINGVVVTGVGQTFAGDYGTLEITAYDPNGSISYTYTLEDNVDHDSDATPFEEFEVVVTDDDGDSASDTLRIDIIDDEPIAVDDTDSIPAGQFGPAVGNVITDAEGDGGEDNVGADDAVVVGVAPGDTNSNLENPATVGVVIQGTYGDLTLNADGSYSYTRDANTPGGVQDVFTYTIEDGDGDQTNATLTITIGDSEPDVPENTNVGLDDDALTGGNAAGPNDDPDAVNTSGSVAAVGGDGTITYALSETGAPAGFTYDLQGNGDLHILQGTTHVLTVTLDASGNYTVTQVAPILHDPGDTENNETFVVTFSATDLDGGSDEGTLTINVDDDTPVNFNPVDLTDETGATATTLDDALVNDGTANVIRFLNDANANPANGENFIGADGFGDLVFTSTGHVDGEALESTGGTPLTSGGDPIYLFGFGTGVLTATTSADNSDPSAVVFTVTLTEGAGYGSASTYTIDFNQAIDDGSGFVFDDFSTAPAGQNDWVGLDADGLDINDPTDPNANSEDLLLTPTNAGGSINTSATDIGNANQWIDAGEGVRLDYVIDVRRDPGSDEKDVGGYAFDGHYNVTDSSFTIMQTQGGGTAAVQITAFNDPDTGNLDTLSGTIVDIDPASIVVTGQAAGTYQVFDMGDGTVVITGLQPGSSVEFEAEGGATFNSYSITNASGVLNTTTPAPGDTFTGDAFAVGVFGFNSETQGNPIDMSFDVTASDADGDTSTGTIDVTLVPADSSSSLTTLASTSQEEQLQKSAANSNTLTLAAAVAASGMSGNAAAHHDGDSSRGEGGELANFAAPEVIEHVSVSDDGGDAAVSMLAVEPAAEESAPAASSSSSSADSSNSGLDDDAQAAPESNEAPAGDGGSADNTAEAANPVAPTVSMASADALAAAANDNGNAQQGGSVEQIVADALAQGDAPSVEDLLAGLPGGSGELPAVAHIASPEPNAVSAWDMGSHGAIGAGFDMLFKMDVANMHHDAVQPVANG